MLLYKYLPDCCDQCCDYEKPDPLKDKVVFNLPVPPQGKVLAKQNEVFHNDPINSTAMAENIVPAKQKELETSARILEEVALMERQAEEARELKRVRETADALEAQEIVEAQELLEAQEASLKEHDLTLQRLQQSDDADTEQRRKEEHEDEQKVDAFLKANGFANLDSKRTKLFKSFYPLHSAVSQKNVEMVQLLLATGARPTLKNSSGLSPLQFAQKLNRNDSHRQIIKLLDFGSR